jgi:hypothetical protein
MAEVYEGVIWSPERGQYESASVRRHWEQRKGLGSQRDDPDEEEGIVIGDYRDQGVGEDSDWEDVEVEESEDEDAWLGLDEEEEELGRQVTKPYIDAGDDDLEAIEKSGTSLESLMDMGGLSVSAWKQLVEMRKDRVYRAIQDLSDGESPVFTDQVADYLGLEDESEIQPIMDDLAEDGLVKPVKEVSPTVERAMTDLRGAWNGLVRQDKQRQREQLRREVRNIRNGLDRLLGRR